MFSLDIKGINIQIKNVRSLKCNQLELYQGKARFFKDKHHSCVTRYWRHVHNLVPKLQLSGKKEKEKYSDGHPKSYSLWRNVCCIEFDTLFLHIPTISFQRYTWIYPSNNWRTIQNQMATKYLYEFASVIKINSDPYKMRGRIIIKTVLQFERFKVEPLFDVEWGIGKDISFPNWYNSKQHKHTYCQLTFKEINSWTMQM